MPNAYTIYWEPEGYQPFLREVIPHSATDEKGDILPGDRIFLVMTKSGAVNLLGAFTVDEVWDAKLRGRPPRAKIDKNYYLMPKTGSASIVECRYLNPELVKSLRFEGPKKEVLFKGGQVAPQALRARRKLTPDSAKALEIFLMNRDKKQPVPAPPPPPPVGCLAPAKSIASATVFSRDAAVREWVLKRSGGSCEACETPAPFLDSNGFPYLEVHHMKHLSLGGSDTVWNTIALCPNCHRRLHFAKDANGYRDELYRRLPVLKKE